MLSSFRSIYYVQYAGPSELGELSDIIIGGKGSFKCLYHLPVARSSPWGGNRFSMAKGVEGYLCEEELHVLD
jgi:hypothetical protein